ncbi:MAG TPA: nuclear transport factor 2 family protein [Jatrophihabitans sp.]|jgi:3-phenylpropionate/cinnamic acid dioxygenase small subunit
MSDDRTRAEIGALLAVYNAAADAVDLDRFVDCFTHDATFDFVNEGLCYSGTEQLRAMLAGSSRAGVHRTELLDVEGGAEQVRVSSRLTELRRDTGELFRTGTYDDTVRRDGDCWRFTSRRLTYELGRLDRPQEVAR